MDTTNPQKPSRIWRILHWIRKRLVPLAGLLLALAIIIAVGYLYFRHPDVFKRFQNYGYFGAFIISVFLNATVIIPVSNMAVIFSLGGSLPLPWLVGIVGGIGAAIGELTGYIAGRSGRGLLAKNVIYTRIEGWVKRWGWIAVFILSIVPFAFDVVGIIAGALRMPVWRFLIACWLGRTIIYVTVACLASLGFRALPWLG